MENSDFKDLLNSINWAHKHRRNKVKKKLKKIWTNKESKKSAQKSITNLNNYLAKKKKKSKKNEYPPDIRTQIKCLNPSKNIKSIKINPLSKKERLKFFKALDEYDSKKTAQKQQLYSKNLTLNIAHPYSKSKSENWETNYLSSGNLVSEHPIPVYVDSFPTPINWKKILIVSAIIINILALIILFKSSLSQTYEMTKMKYVIKYIIENRGLDLIKR